MTHEYELDSSACATKGGMCFHSYLNPFVRLETIAAGHLTYIIVIFGLKYLLRNSEPRNIKVPMIVYNLVQIILSVTMTVGLAPYLMNGFFNINGKFNAKIEFWIFVHYCTKYLDMLDSLFMVLRKKDDQLSFLHVYHHLTIGAIWGCLLHFGYGNGAAFFGAWINSLVHAIMYFHYFWTGIGFRNPFKQYITMFQMFQFSLCIFQAILVVLLDKQFTFRWACLQLCYHISLLYLFGKFFVSDKKKRTLAKKKAP